MTPRKNKKERQTERTKDRYEEITKDRNKERMNKIKTR